LKEKELLYTIIY
jgi:hypothetical protein